MIGFDDEEENCMYLRSNLTDGPVAPIAPIDPG